MYVDKIQIQNYGPISNIELEPQFDANGNPLPVILIGKNGTGKTLLLGNILDGIIELKRKKYNQLKEVEDNKYLKIGSMQYIRYEQDFSYVNINNKANENSAKFTDVMRHISFSDFQQKYPNISLDGLNLGDMRFQKTGFYKASIPSNDDILNVFNKNLFLFFPHSRYDHPAWLNKKTEIGFSFNENFIDQSNKNIIKHNVLLEIETWLLDCLLDREIYEKQIHNRNTYLKVENNGNAQYMPYTLSQFSGYIGKNNTILNLINQILLIIYKSKYPDILSARLGFGAKANRSISIHIQEKGKPEIVVSPTFSHLSSGEVMLLALFASLLKEYDDLGISPTSLDDLTGIVIIDEIDLHLHIEFQKSILPELITRFPKVQFFITTHSPFFLLGMEEKYKDRYSLISLPYGNKIKVDEFEEMQFAYQLFIDEFNSLQNTFKTVNARLETLTKPIIITEGKTDWKHLKAALRKLQAQGKFTNLDFDFLEYSDEIHMGDSHLQALCEQYSKIPQSRKVICIFDRDSDSIVKQMSGINGRNYKNWGHSVYSFCIPVPSHRNFFNNISIEFYYTDSEITTVDPVTQRRLFFSNEIEEVMIKSATTKKTQSSIRILEQPKQEEEKDKKVYAKDIDKIKDSSGSSIAHSKNAFADKILNNHSGFESFSFSEFEKIFTVIEEILLN
ncbi:AAA family ATPase [Pontibacter toksunensis]|uniref:AAA family ATPase n=1 Tax=Pontibacter toksunensis TaxID=1332631 RepID=A0ABW6C2W3_9BACT